MFSAFNPSKCTHTWSSGQPTVQRPGSSRGLPAGAGIKSNIYSECKSPFTPKSVKNKPQAEGRVHSFLYRRGFNTLQQ